MNSKKLNELCAIKVIGDASKREIHPTTDMNDALMVLGIAASKQRVAQWWEICSVIGYRACLIDVNDAEYFVSLEKSPQVAMCVCALRASGVTEAEIQEAMK